MKKSKQTKKSAPGTAVGKLVTPEQAPTEMPEQKSTAALPSFDPERDELAYDDERGENYVRKTPLGMLEEAQAEADQRELADYRDTISLLRQKGFNFREIAEFLTKRGVFADHNAVYRIYTKFMTPEEIQAEAEMDEEEKERAVEDGTGQ